MKYVPLPCQAEAEQFLIKNKRGGLFVRMGVGKTIVGLSVAESLMYNYAAIRRVLVIAPKRVALLTWPDEIAKWDHTRKLTYTVLHGSRKEDRLSYAKRVDITIINYEGLSWLWDNQGKLPKYDLVIFDESTYVKNSGSGRTKIAHKLARHIPRVIILTGTPKPNGIKNLWSQIFLLDRGQRLGGNITTFRNEYMIPGQTVSQYFPKAGARKKVLDLIKDLVLVVEDTQGVGLPPVKDNLIDVELPPKVQKMYDALENDWLLTLDTGEQIDVLNMQSQAQKLRQIASGFIYTDKEKNTQLLHKEKLMALKELQETLDSNMLVAINFTHEVNMIREHFGYEVPAIFSETADKQSTQWLRDWMAGKLPMLLAHPASMSHGLNLQSGGHNIVWYSLTWDLELWLQFIARLRRRGSNAATIFNHIIRARGTIDDVLLRVVSHKDEEQEDSLQYLRDYRTEKKKQRRRV